MSIVLSRTSLCPLVLTRLSGKDSVSRFPSGFWSWLVHYKNTRLGVGFVFHRDVLVLRKGRHSYRRLFREFGSFEDWSIWDWGCDFRRSFLSVRVKILCLLKVPRDDRMCSTCRKLCFNVPYVLPFFFCMKSLCFVISLGVSLYCGYNLYWLLNFIDTKYKTSEISLSICYCLPWKSTHDCW